MVADLKQFIVTTVSQGISGMATKDDLAAFATKEDMEALATKDDLARLEDKVDGIQDFLENSTTLYSLR